MYPNNAHSGASLARAIALVAILAAPLVGYAADKTTLRPVLELEQGWDSNVFNDAGGDSPSLITRLSPGLWLENTGELGFARLGVTAIGRSVWQQSTLSGIDSGARGDFERRLTPRLSLLGNGLVDYYSGYSQITDVPSAEDPSGLILGEQPAWARNQIGLGFRYLLTPRTALRINGGAGRVNYEQLDSSFCDPTIAIRSSGCLYRDRGIQNLRGSLQYQLTALDEVGLSVDGENTSYQDLGTGSNDSEIWNSRLTWSRTWSPQWSTSASFGARIIESEQKDTPQNGGVGYYDFCPTGLCPFQAALPLDSRSFSGSGTGVIGSLSIERTFERSSLRLTYDRDTRSTAGSGTTNFDIDSFTLSLTHRLAERVKLSLSGNYSLYQSVTDEIPSYAAIVTPSVLGPTEGAKSCRLGGSASIVGGFDHPSIPGEVVPIYQCFGGSSQEDRSYTTLTGRIDWQLRRQVSAFLVARYYVSTIDQSLGSGVDIQADDLDKLTVGIGFRYAWDLGL